MSSVSNRQAAIACVSSAGDGNRAREVLLDSEERYRLLADNVTDLIYVTDMQLRPTYMSPSVTRLLGYSVEEAMARTIEESLTPASLRVATRAFAKVLAEDEKGQEGSYTPRAVELEFVRRDGSTVWTESTVSFLHDKDGRPSGILGVTRDISERKKAEERIQYQANLLANVNDAIIAWEQHFRLTSWNRAAERMYGWKAEEVLGRPGQEVLDSQFVGVKRSEVIRTLKDTGQFRGEMVQCRKDSTPIYVEATAIMLKNDSGKVTGYVTVNRDITERKKAEAEQGKLSEELAEKNRDLEQIVYVTSHDLRSPLVNVQGFSQELSYSLQELVSILRDVDMLPEQREKVSNILSSDLPEALMYIQASALKMDCLLSGLLRLSRVGRVGVNLEPLDMNLLLSDIVKSFEYRIKEASCNVEIGDLPACTGDAGQINQLFSNLLDNALKYLDPSRLGMISITGRKEKHQVVYCVEDNGVGISKKHQKKIFELFYRIDPQACSGEGLGLSIARKILSRHGGIMWVESEPGVGSKFFASLPPVK